jgi:isocitrate dehydrogenase
MGVDVFIDWWNGQFYGSAKEIGQKMEQLNGDGLKLQMISNRGTKVYPDGLPDTFCVDHWRCRFISADGNPISHQQIINLLTRCQQAGFDFIKTENLYYFDGKPGFSLGQGQ